MKEYTFEQVEHIIRQLIDKSNLVIDDAGTYMMPHVEVVQEIPQGVSVLLQGKAQGYTYIDIAL